MSNNTENTGSTQHREQATHGVSQPVYIVCSVVMNTILGFLGVGIGFAFFVGTAIAGGSIGLMVLVFGGGAVMIALYLYMIYLFNRLLVKYCSQKKKSREDKIRFLYSMVYGIVILAGTFVFAFLQAGLASH